MPRPVLLSGNRFAVLAESDAVGPEQQVQETAAHALSGSAAAAKRSMHPPPKRPIARDRGERVVLGPPPSGPLGGDLRKLQARLTARALERQADLEMAIDPPRMAICIESLGAGPRPLYDSGAALFGYLDPHYWRSDRDGYWDHQPFGAYGTRFSWRGGLAPARAFDDGFLGETPTLDSRALLELSQIGALLEVIGEEKFNLIFSSDGPAPLQITSFAKPMFWGERPSGALQRGDVVVCGAPPRYFAKRPAEGLGRLAAIMLGEDQFQVVGWFHPQSGDDYCGQIVRCFDDVATSELSSLLPSGLRDRVTREIGQRFTTGEITPAATLGEFPLEGLFRVNPKCVQELIDAAVEDVRSVAQKWIGS